MQLAGALMHYDVAKKLFLTRGLRLFDSMLSNAVKLICTQYWKLKNAKYGGWKAHHRKHRRAYQ